MTDDIITPDPWRIEGSCSYPDGAKGVIVSYGINSYGDGPMGYVARIVGASAADARAMIAAPALLEALRGLAGNAGALRAFEWEIRAAAGNTNWQCLMDAVAAADAAIALARGQ